MDRKQLYLLRKELERDEHELQDLFFNKTEEKRVHFADPIQTKAKPTRFNFINNCIQRITNFTVLGLIRGNLTNIKGGTIEKPAEKMVPILKKRQGGNERLELSTEEESSLMAPEINDEDK